MMSYTWAIVGQHVESQIPLWCRGRRWQTMTPGYPRCYLTRLVAVALDGNVWEPSPAGGYFGWGLVGNQQWCAVRLLDYAASNGADIWDIWWDESTNNWIGVPSPSFKETRLPLLAPVLTREHLGAMEDVSDSTVISQKREPKSYQEFPNLRHIDIWVEFDILYNTQLRYSEICWDMLRYECPNLRHIIELPHGNQLVNPVPNQKEGITSSWWLRSYEIASDPLDWLLKKSSKKSCGESFNHDFFLLSHHFLTVCPIPNSFSFSLMWQIPFLRVSFDLLVRFTQGMDGNGSGWDYHQWLPWIVPSFPKWNAPVSHGWGKSQSRNGFP